MGNPKVEQARAFVKTSARQQIEAELSRLYAEGPLRPSVVVAAAADESSPLHNCFEWDDTKAGHSFRLLQARNLLREVSVTVETGFAPARLIHVPSLGTEGREGTYEPITAVVQSPDKYARALSELTAKMRAASNAIEELKAAAEQTEDQDKMARITVAIAALQTANAAVQALH